MTRPLLPLAIAALVAVLAVTIVTTPGASQLSAAGIDQPVAQEQVIPMTPPDQGGAGLDQYKATDWLTFAVPLGAFLPLIIGLLWLTFRIDHSEANE